MHRTGIDRIAADRTEAVLKHLIELGCEYGQGFQWSPALAPEDFVRFLAKNQEPRLAAARLA